MGGQEPNRTATLSIAPSVAELQRENVVLELECIDRIYLNAFVPNLTSEKGIAGYFREFMGHRFASTKSAGKSEATGQAPGSSQHGRCQRISDRSCRAPERRRRNAQSGIQRPALLLPRCFAPRVWPRRAFGSVAESCPVLAMSQLLGEICSCFAVEITRPWPPVQFVSPGGDRGLPPLDYNRSNSYVARALGWTGASRSLVQDHPELISGLRSPVVPVGEYIVRSHLCDVGIRSLAHEGEKLRRQVLVMSHGGRTVSALLLSFH